MKPGIVHYLLLLIYLLISGMYFFRHQYFNTDIEAYMGIVYRINHPDWSVGQIHRRVYEELRLKNPELVQENRFRKEEVSGENTYYQKLSEDTAAYAEELIFFKVKPFYNHINATFYKLGLPASAATFSTSFASYCGIIFLIFRFLSSILPNGYLAFFLTILISVLKPLTESTRHASPDNLACFLLLAGLYSFLVWRKWIPAVLFSILTLFTRPDYIIFYSLLSCYLFYFRRGLGLKAGQLIASWALLLFSFLLIELLNQIPWSVLFINQFIRVQLFPVSSPDQLTLASYWWVLKSRALLEFNASWFPLLFLFITVGLGTSSGQKRSAVLFFLLVFLSVGIRFLVFPSLVNRMMLGYYLLIILALIWWHAKTGLFGSGLSKTEV